MGDCETVSALNEVSGAMKSGDEVAMRRLLIF